MISPELEQLIRTGSASALQRELDSLASDSNRSRDVLRSLLRSRHSDVRAWVLWAAPRLLSSPQAEELLQAGLNDVHPDVQDAAIEGLLALGPVHAQSLIPRLRKRLRSSDYWTPVLAMWTLARLGDEGARASISAVRSSPAHPWHALDAAVVDLFLSGRRDEILDRLGSHDHEFTPALVRAALSIGSADAYKALQKCAENASDADCQRLCAHALTRVAMRPNPHAGILGPDSGA